MVIRQPTLTTPISPATRSSLPLIVPGPHISSSNVSGNPQTSDNLVLNGSVNSIDVTFDRDMNDSTISGADVLNIMGPSGAISGPFGMALSPANADPAHHRTYRITFPAQVLSGNYRIELGSNIASATGDLVDNNLNAGLDALRGTPSADIKPITYNSTGTQTIGTNASVTTTRSTIHVSDSYPLQSVVVQLNITHPMDSDLEAELDRPRRHDMFPCSTSARTSSATEPRTPTSTAPSSTTMPIRSSRAARRRSSGDSCPSSLSGHFTTTG